MYTFYEIFVKNVHFLRNFRQKCNFVKSVMVDELNITLATKQRTPYERVWKTVPETWALCKVCTIQYGLIFLNFLLCPRSMLFLAIKQERRQIFYPHTNAKGGKNRILTRKCFCECLCACDDSGIAELETLNSSDLKKRGFSFIAIQEAKRMQNTRR